MKKALFGMIGMAVAACISSAQAPAAAKARAKDPQPYELKGDRLGMSLQEFKVHYGPAGSSCSFTEASTDADRDWSRGLVTCHRVSAFEGMPGEKYTLANVPVEIMGFQFVDGRLYSIITYFPQDKFGEVCSAMLEKYGKPQAQSMEIYQNAFGAKFPGAILVWDNGVSRILLQERGTDLKTSLLIFTHTALEQEAAARKPKPKPDL